MEQREADYEALVTAFRDDMAERDLSIPDLARLTGLSPRVVGYALDARRRTIPKSRRRVARALGWETGSIEAVLGGGRPTYLPVPVPAPVAPFTPTEKLAAIKALRADRAAGRLSEKKFRASLHALLDWPETEQTDGGSE